MNYIEFVILHTVTCFEINFYILIEIKIWDDLNVIVEFLNYTLFRLTCYISVDCSTLNMFHMFSAGDL